MRRSLIAFLALLLVPASGMAEGWEMLGQPNRALMLIMPEAANRPVRQAASPADCDNAEWLSEAGREQARRIGERLRSEGLAEARVFTSPSCAAVETGRLLSLSRVAIQPLLNDILQTSLSRTRQREEFALFVADYYGSPPFVMVTHRNNVLDLSELYLEPGDGIVLQLAPSIALPQVLGPARLAGSGG